MRVGQSTYTYHKNCAIHYVCFSHCHERIKHNQSFSFSFYNANTGGCTNVIYRVDTTKGQNFLLRVFGVGTEMLIDRRREACCFRAVAIRGLGPKLLGTFGNGRVEEFLQARVCMYIRT